MAMPLAHRTALRKNRKRLECDLGEEKRTLPDGDLANRHPALQSMCSKAGFVPQSRFL
jgi:hypothetical protein